VKDDQERDGPRNHEARRGSLWADVKRGLSAVLAALVALVGGFINGASFGANHAPDFSFSGMPGYEGGGLLGGMVSGLSVLLIAVFAVFLLRPMSRAALVVAGALAMTLFGAPALFPVIPPQEWALALTYLSCTVVGTLVGLGVSALATRRR
jgi:hypothetical protein